MATPHLSGTPPRPSSLVTLGERSVDGTHAGAIDMLLDCHQRIRRFCELGVQLASAEGHAAAEIKDAAERLHRYFTIAFPLHIADEEESLRPRLSAVPLDRTIATALDAMSREHVEGEALLAELVPIWAKLSESRRKRTTPKPPGWALWQEQELIGDPAQAELRASSLPSAERLRTLLEGHLALEETTILPALTSLVASAELDAIAREMRARRRV